MTHHHNPVGDLVDEAVDVLTRLAGLTGQASQRTGQCVGFADRLADVLTHVAANVRGVAHLTDGSCAGAAGMLGGLVELSTDPQDLIAWRTTPILVRAFDGDRLPAHAPVPLDSIGLARWRQERQSALAAYQESLLETMRAVASELGYNAEVVIAVSEADLVPEDAQLIDYLQDSAHARTAPPDGPQGH